MTAWQSKTANLHATIVEARDRIGGRIHTLRTPGAPIRSKQAQNSFTARPTKPGRSFAPSVGMPLGFLSVKRAIPATMLMRRTKTAAGNNFRECDAPLSPSTLTLRHGLYLGRCSTGA